MLRFSGFFAIEQQLVRGEIGRLRHDFLPDAVYVHDSHSEPRALRSRSAQTAL